MLKINRHFHLQVRRFLSRPYVIPIVVITLTLLLTYLILSMISVPRPPRLKSGSGDTLYSASNKIFSTGIGTKDGTPEISFTRGNSGLRFVLSGSNKVKPVKTSSTVVTFPGVQPGIDLVYSTLAGGLKEELVIDSPSSLTSNVFLFDLTLNNAHSSTMTTGFLDSTFRNSEGDYLFHFEKPYAQDASGNRTDDVLLQIMEDKQLPGNYSLKLIVDEVWLNDPSRLYPITIDPTIVHDTTAEFATGTFNRVFDAGSGSSPRLESYYQELVADEYTVGLWHMDEGTDNTCTGGTNDVCDSSGNGLDGAFSGNTTFTTDSKIGPSATIYDGVSGQVTIADNDKLSFTDKKFTIEAWVKRNGNPAAIEYLVLKGVAVWEYTMRIATTGLVQTVIWGSGSGTSIGSASSTKTVTDGEWHHIAMVVDGSYSYIYIDGELDGSVAVVGTLSNTTASLYFGDRSDVANSELEGSIDNVRISNINRSAEEIKAAASRRPSSVYTSEVLDLGGASSWVTAWNNFSWTELGVTTGDGETLSDSTGLIAQWNFNETSGTTATNNAGSCGASCNGTLTNFASTASQDQAAGTGWTANNRRWGAGALMFDGSNDYVSIPNNASLNIGGGPFTIETWVKPNILTSRYGIFSTRTANTAGSWQLEAGTGNGGTARVSVTGVGTWIFDSVDSVISVGSWYHIAYVRTSNSDTGTLYVNSKSVPANTTTAYTISNNTDAKRIGEGISGTQRFHGTIDSTRIYSRALTASEILSNYQSGQIELQTRVGNTTTPDDGSWEAWQPTTNESQILNMDSDQTDWVWDNSSTYVPKTQSNDTNIKVEGSGSLKQTVGQPQVDGNTVGLWHLDETGGSGAYIKDSSGNGNHGTPTGTTTTQGITSKARAFNGSSDYIDMGDIDAIDSASALSGCAWVYHNSSTADHQIIGKNNSATDGFQFFRDDVGAVSGRTDIYAIFIADSADTDNARIEGTTNSAIANKWNHVCFTFQANSATGLRLYINGSEDANSPVSTSTIGLIGSGSNPLRIGSTSAGGSLFHGIIDEAGIWNRTLANEEIAEAYRAGRDHYINRTFSSTDLSGKTTLPFYVAADRPGSYLQASIGETPYGVGQPDANTVGFWRLDEQSGSGAYLKDSSGSNLHGTPTNTTHTEGKIGKGRYFAGASTNHYVTITGDGSTYSTNTYTLEAWVNPTGGAGTNRFIIDKRDAANDGYYMQISTTNIFGCGYNAATAVTSPTSPALNTWHHVICTSDGSTLSMYVNGVLVNTGAISGNISVTTNLTIGGRSFTKPALTFFGIIDEAKISNTARTAEEIRASYEYGLGLRSHQVTIDFGADLDSSNLIANSGDLSFTVDATVYGLSQMGSMLFAGDKVIVRENYDGTEYLAQGTVTGVTPSTGAVTVASWDSGSTFPSGGYTAGASVFKWQREYWNHRGEVLDSHLDGITQLSLRLTDGVEGRTIWLDDFKSSGGYLTDPAGSSITSSVGERYFQYRAVLSSSDEAVSPQLSMVTLDYDINVAPNTPSLDAPTDTAGNQSLTPTLLTTATDDDGDYIRYKIELCEDSGMSVNCQTYDQTSSQVGWSGQNAQTGTAYTSGTQATYTLQTPLASGTTYYWRTSAIDPAGTNTWGDTQTTPYSFTTTTAPSAPTIPWTEGSVNPTGVTDTTPEFSAIHNDPDGDPAVFYEIEVNTNNTFTGTVMWDSGQSAMSSLADGVRSSDISYAGSTLDWGTTYYWRIRFTDDLGAEGAWSATSSFTMNYTPNTPSLDAPSDTATNQSLTPTFRTTATDDDSDYLRYKFELCEDSGMSVNCQTFDQTISQTNWSGQDAETSTAYASGTQASYTITTNLSVFTTYYWRSYAIDPAGTNVWSSTQTPYSFTTRKLHESFYCLIDETLDDSSLTITWSDRETLEDSYKLERNVNGGGFTLYQTLPADSTSYQDTSISSGNTYAYRVAPFSNTGSVYADWCTTATLTLETGLFNFSGLNFNGLLIN